MNRGLLLLSVGLVAGCSDSPSSPVADTANDTADMTDIAVPADTDAAEDVAADVPTTLGTPGAPCDSDDDCDGPNPTCLGLPSGYCAPDCATTTCPEGSVCYAFEDGSELCLASCARDADCRRSEGYVCDADDTCWWYEPTGDGDSGIGGPCTRDEDCKDAGATCYEEGFDGNANGFVGGYCLVFDCTANSCPDGARCVEVTSAGDTACFAACGENTPCPRQEGYFCAADDLACWPGCDSSADCPEGYGCSDEIGSCVFGLTDEPFVCSDTRYEPNNARGDAASIAVPASIDGLDLCASDEDWFKVTSEVGYLTTVGINFNHVVGDLDLVAYDENGALLGSRMGPESYGASLREYENGVEYHSVLNQSGTTDAYFRVKPFSGATNTYTLSTTRTAWVDGAMCEAPFTPAECIGTDGAGTTYLYQFPFARADDPYVPDGYRLESASSYRWARRELIMLIRTAIRAVQQKFPGTTPLGLLDMSDKTGTTPGFDIGAPRHPETTHDQGGNIDIAYYQTDGTNNEGSVCGPRDAANQDGSYCTSTNGHILDVPRTTYFIAILASHPRLRVIGVDKLLAPLILAEAERQRDAGDITTTQLNAIGGALAYGDGWPYHFAHMHVSMDWWTAGLANGQVIAPEPPIGCGFRHAHTAVDRHER